MNATLDGMSNVPKHKPREAQRVQSKRFIETAKELETDPDPKAFERMMRSVDLRKKPTKPKARRKK